MAAFPSERDFILARAALWVRLSGRLTPEEWDVVAEFVHEAMMAGLPDAHHPDLESDSAEIPNALLLKLANPLGFTHEPACPDCGRHVVVIHEHDASD